MSDIDILKDFQEESKAIVKTLLDLLEEIEGQFEMVKKLEIYGQQVDRIMGGAKSLGMTFPPEHSVHKVGDYSALCKAVGYKASQIENNEDFFNICVALLLDATEVLADMVDQVDSAEHLHVGEMVSQTFLDRLKWVSNQFNAEVRASVAVSPDAPKKMSQTEIDDLLKRLGL